MADPVLKEYALSGSIIPLRQFLHLKSGVAYLGGETLIVSGECCDCEQFAEFDLIKIDDDEMYAANCLCLNGTVVVAAGFPKTKLRIKKLGFPVVELDMSEFRKLDGGLSCLSLRF